MGAGYGCGVWVRLYKGGRYGCRAPKMTPQITTGDNKSTALMSATLAYLPTILYHGKWEMGNAVAVRVRGRRPPLGRSGPRARQGRRPFLIITILAWESPTIAEGHSLGMDPMEGIRGDFRTGINEGI
eukprot:gene9269-biopygen5770